MAQMRTQEDLTWPPQAQAPDHLVVSTLWCKMEQLLKGQTEEGEVFIRQLVQMLPPLESVPPRDLAGIARIHLQSAAHIKTTMRLLVPEAFAGSDTSLADFADRLPPSAEPMVLRLIDLQILHLNRTQEVTAQMRAHAEARQACMQMRTAADAGSATTGSSSDTRGAA